MKHIEVKDQTRLPFSKCVELVLSGIRYRLFRASITIAIISLAVAFLMTMLTESIAARRVADRIDTLIAPRQLFNFWVARISAPLSERDLTDQLAKTRKGGLRWNEFQTWGRLPDERLEKLISVAHRQKMYLAYFAKDLDEGQRRLMLGRARGTDILTLLQDKRAYDRFAAEYGRLKRLMPTDLESFKAFLGDWRVSRSDFEAIRKGHESARQQVVSALDEREPTVVLAGADESLMETLAAHGFQLTGEQMEIVRRQASLAVDAGRLRRLLSMSLVLQRLADKQKVDKADINARMFFSLVGTSSGAKWLVELCKSDAFRKEAAARGVPLLEMSAKQIKEAAEQRLEQAELAKVEEVVWRTARAKGALLGFSSRAVWLMVVSFVVCVVGIANAMLMSVTERFREIATMKCLGATDGYIMINFILESCLQGTAGGIIGAVLGFLLGALRSWVSYGWIAMANLPVLVLVTVAGASVMVGVVLSALAAVYPAWIAARLAPMEAMRIE